jgi:hypothetical protein
MRLWRLRNDKELLLRNQQRVEAPRSDKDAIVIVVRMVEGWMS